MRTSSFVIFILFLIQAFSAGANSKFALVVGGSDDPTQKTSVFDYDFHYLIRNLSAADYQILTAFNGENQETMSRVVQPWIQKKKIQWRPANIESVQQLQKAISQQIRSGDQLLIILIGHGAPRNGKQLTHNIELNQDRQWNLDELKTWIDPLLAKEIKVALVDSSCRSGASLDLGSPNLCVMSSSNSESLGYYNFLTAFNRETWSRQNCWLCSKSLDQIFLRTRREMILSSPLISIQTNKQILAQTEAFQIIINHYLAQKAIYWNFNNLGSCPTCYSRTYPQFQERLEKARSLLLSEPLPGLDAFQRRELQVRVENYLTASAELFSLTTNTQIDPQQKSFGAQLFELEQKQQQAYDQILKFERITYERAYRKSRAESIKDPCSEFHF